MAAEQGTNVEMKAHEQTYAGFVRLLKISTAICAIVTLLVLFAISR
jgi:hypothetical protein